MTSVVRLEKVSRHFGKVRAVVDLDLEVAAGEVLGLLGHNGAGKSTTMKMILGVLAPSAGQVQVLGENPRGRAAGHLRLQLGYLPENVSFYDNLSGREVLRYFARLKRIEVKLADRLLERVGLGEAADRRVRTYSKGMRQRLGLAQALLGAPKLLLLDEPTVGLDPIATRDVYDMIDELRETGTSVILSSHVLAGVEKHLDRVAILAHGRLQADGTIDALRQQANLPLRVRARTTSLNGQINERLAKLGLNGRTVRNDLIEFDAPASRKLEIMRALLTDEDITDVNVDSPSLESLYTHFNRLADAPEDANA
jgi:Cu-processing system ATP-binding protein